MRLVRAVSLSPDSVELIYMDDASDLRAEGLVYQSHTLVISRLDQDLDDEIDGLETAVNALLEAGVRRWATSTPVTPEHLDNALYEDDDEEDDE